MFGIDWDHDGKVETVEDLLTADLLGLLKDDTEDEDFMEDEDFGDDDEAEDDF